MAPAKPEVFHADHAHHQEAVTLLHRQAPTALDHALRHHLSEVVVETADRRIEAGVNAGLRTVEVEAVAFQVEAVAEVVEGAHVALPLTSLSTSTATLFKQHRKKYMFQNISLLILDFQLPLLHL